MPGGFRLAEELNESIPLSVFPSWDLFLGFNDRQKTVQGKLTLMIMYDTIAYRYVQNPRDIIYMDNFATGDLYPGGIISVVNSATGREAHSTSSIYVGDFSQAYEIFDHLCYPFDSKTVYFHVTVQKPGNYVFDLNLLCPESMVLEEEVLDGQRVVTCTSLDPAGNYVGFDWDKFRCELKAGQRITCSMTGIRQWDHIAKGYLWPSFTFSAMGFISFLFSVKLAMPRVATTMLALISLTNFRNALMAHLPSSGNTSWIEEYFLIAMTFMLLNLCGHALSFYLDGIGKSDWQHMVNKFNFFGMLSISLLSMTARLHVRGCENIDGAAMSVCTILCSLLVIVVFASISWRYRETIKDIAASTRSHFSSATEIEIVPIYKEDD